MKDITCLGDAPFCNESEYQARKRVERSIRQFNKETLKSEKQARLEGMKLMRLFIWKKQLFSYDHHELYVFNGDTKVLQFPHQGVGGKVFLVGITTEEMQ